MTARRFLPEGVHDYFITARSANKDWFRLPLEQVWELFQEHLYFLHHSFDVQVRAAVLMANHYHMIATVDSDELPYAMTHLQSHLARDLNRRSGRINQVWGRPYHSSVITTHTHFRNVYKYLYRNPVQAKVCKLVEQYPYSSIRGLVGLQKLIAPVFDDILLNDLERSLRWLNEDSFSPEDLRMLRSALKKSRFDLPRRDQPLIHDLNVETP